jgi:hypothetical protein
MMKGGFIYVILFGLLLAPTTFLSQTCLDNFLAELELSNKMPESKGLCYDEGAYWKFWKAGTKYSKSPSTRWKASYCYKQAARFGFKFAWFNLEYSKFLVEEGKLHDALKILKEVPASDALYNNGQLKIAEILIWSGAYSATNRVLSSIQVEEKSQIGESKKNLLRICDSLAAPVVKQEAFFNADNQPLALIGHSFVFRQGKSKALNYQIGFGNSYYLSNLSRVQTRINVQNSFSISPINTSINVGLGVVGFGTNDFKPTCLLGIRTQVNDNLVNELKIERKAYDLTRASIGSVLLMDQLMHSFRINKSSGLSIEWNGTYSKLTNSQSSQLNLYSWVLSPYLMRTRIKPRIGGFLGYANSNQILYSAVLSYDQIIAGGDLNNIEGVFTSWFTPNQMRVVGLIADVGYSPNVTFKLNCTSTIGLGISKEPFLYLTNDEIGLSSYDTYFIPTDVKVNAMYYPSRSLELKVSYEFRNTVFNTAQYMLFSLSKRL